ncbi:hypothetical protein K8089_16295, partial [Aequorivita sp. F47161]
RCATYCQKTKTDSLLKKTLLNLILISFLFGCSEKEEIYINPDLKKKIGLIVQSYNSADNNYYKPDIYEVHFTEIENECYVAINTNIFYRTNLDGHVFLKDKLITFNNTKSECNNGLVKIKTSNKKDNLTDFPNENQSFDNYSPAYWYFKITDKGLKPDKQGKFKIDFN